MTLRRTRSMSSECELRTGRDQENQARRQTQSQLVLKRVSPTVIVACSSLYQLQLWFIYSSSAFSLFGVGASSFQSPRSRNLRSCASSIYTPFSFTSFLLTSLSFGLPIFRCPPTFIFNNYMHTSNRCHKIQIFHF